MPVSFQEWRSIPWAKRNEIIAFFQLGRSGQIKVSSRGVEDDGVIEKDLTLFAGLSLEDILALRKEPAKKAELAPESVAPKVAKPKGRPKKK